MCAHVVSNSATTACWLCHLLVFDAAAVFVMAIPDSSVQRIHLRCLRFGKAMSELHKHEVTILGSNILGQYCAAGLLEFLCLTHGFLYTTCHSKVWSKGHRNHQILMKRKYE